MVQGEIHRRDGVESQHDPHTGCSLRGRGAAQRNEVGGPVTRLEPGVALRRLVDTVACRPGRGLLDGGEPRDPEGIPRRPSGPLLHRLSQALHRLGFPRDTRERRGRVEAVASAPRERPGPLRVRREPRLQVPHLRRNQWRAEAAAGQRRVPLGEARREVEPGDEGRRGRIGDRAGPFVHR